jgi:hypothetical protein
MGSNPGTVYWMDVILASYYIHKKNENKGKPKGTPKKYLKEILKTVSVSQLEIRCPPPPRPLPPPPI